jgi:hypothetical protein
MSKPFLRFSSILLVCFACLCGATSATAQRFEAEITIDAGRSVASVSGRFLSPGTEFTHVNLSFAESIAGHNDLAKRIRGLEIFDQRGAPVGLRKMIDSEYLAQAGIVSWKYEVDLKPLKDVNAAAHTSWISEEAALIMLADVLPTTESSGDVTLRPPADWSVFTTETLEPGNVFKIRDAGRAVFALGRRWQKVQIRDPRTNIDVIASGQWHFTPAEAASMTREIARELTKTFGDLGDRRRQVILSNFPTTTRPAQWAAETRGDTVTIISSDMPFRTQSLQRLHEQLRHELFHLWIPNGVNLSGSYDWFYEGFALYQSLKLAVALNRIRFEDFLDTLSRAHTIDSAQSRRTSLIQASATRFAGSNTQLYARGILVAFLCDLALLDQTKGKRSVENVLAEFFVKHRTPATPVDANTAVVALLKSNPRVVPVVDKYVIGSEKIEWATDIALAGIEDSDAGILTSLRVKEKLTGRQKAVLDKLGYNNWRKLAPTSK